MKVRTLAALMLGLTGCVSEPHSRLVSPEGSMQTALSRAIKDVPQAPAAEATAKRVLAVGQKVVAANQQAGLRPIFVTVGTAEPEIFHKGGGDRGWQVFLTEGLVNACKSEAQLAAVLCLEMAQIVAEREALAGPAARLAEPRLPPDDPIGPDARGAFGSPDGTRYLEQARVESQRRRPGKGDLPLPSPSALARTYLTKAGYDPAALAQVAPLLRKAEDHFALEKSMRTVEIGAPIPAQKVQSTK